MNKFVVITSIFSPTKAVKLFSKYTDWKLIVVGDKKTPIDWCYKNVIYIGPDEQSKLNFEIVKKLPWNHYSRKMIGYLVAMKMGADIIADSDDDNLPRKGWGEVNFKGDFDYVNNDGFVNVYKFFTTKKVWPRGFPLDEINIKRSVNITRRRVDVGVFQYLADKTPDTDAIYRLVDNSEVKFRRRDPLVFANGAFSPINSQNTFFRKELFALLYLPAFVSFRFTDILRGYACAPIIWNTKYCLGYGDATVVQIRNEHDLLKDFKSESSFYGSTKQIMNVIINSTKKDKSITENLTNVYKGLALNGFAKKEELELLNSWIRDVNQIYDK